VGFAQGIRFNDKITWSQMLNNAKIYNKYIFIDAYTTWCIPCKEMSVNVFPNQTLGEYINERFISVKVQMDETENDSDHVKNWRKYARRMETIFDVGVYPTILLLSPDGSLVAKSEGLSSPDELLLFIQRTVTNYEALVHDVDEFHNGNADTSFLKRLVVKAESLLQNEIANDVAQSFINGLSEKELLQKDNLLFTYVYTKRSSDRGFKFFQTSSTEVDKTLRAPNASKHKINTIIFSEEVKPYTINGVPDWNEITTRIVRKYGYIDREYYHGFRMIYALDKELWKDFGKYYKLYFKVAYSRSGFHINNLSWKVFQHINNKRTLRVAVKTMKYNNEHKDINSPITIDTYANLLYKLGRRRQAIQWESKAVELSNKQLNFVNTLTKMKNKVKTWQ
jgi:thioredoxin-related protein